MKAYVVTTGVVFGLITLAHVLRIAQEGSQLAREPAFILLTLASTALAVWAGWLVLLARKAHDLAGPSLPE